MIQPYLTADLPGVGGRVRVVPDDFFVQEVPLYRPIGIGEHTYIEIEKVGMTTYEAVGRLARELGIKEGEFGVAGLKDRHAVARQTFSVRGIPPEQLLQVSLPGLRVVWAKRHVNKLRIGHLQGNAFKIRIREMDIAPAEARERAEAIFSMLEKKGVPNYFGEQRFGGRGDNHIVGRALVFRDPGEAIHYIVGDPEDAASAEPVREARRAFRDGDLDRAHELFPLRFSTERRVLRQLRKRPEDPGGAVLAMGKNMMWLYVSAYQSSLFNRCLVSRITDIDRIFAGDLAIKHVNGAVFRVEDVELEQERADGFEISPSGPLFGRKMIEPDEGGEAGRIEREVAAVEGLTQKSFEKIARGVSPKGARRAYRFALSDLAVEEVEDGLSLSFFLPRGSYATAVLREVMKVEMPELAEARVEG